jgi:hypothetical protein
MKDGRHQIAERARRRLKRIRSCARPRVELANKQNHEQSKSTSLVMFGLTNVLQFPYRVLAKVAFRRNMLAP